MVLVVVFVALPLVSVAGRGESLETRRVFDGPRGRRNIISIGWIGANTYWGLRSSIGGSRYRTRTPSVKSCKLWVAKIDLLMIPDGRKKERKRKRKRILLSGNEPHYFPGN